MTVLKICERSFKWDLTGCSSSIRLEMALEWRQVVKNSKIHYAIFILPVADGWAKIARISEKLTTDQLTNGRTDQHSEV